MVAATTEAIAMAAPDAREPVHPDFGWRWYEYLRLLAVREQAWLSQMGQLRYTLLERERKLVDRKAVMLTAVASARDEASGKPLYGNDATREAACKAALAADEEYAWALGERDEAQHQLDALDLQIESAKRARRDAHAFLAWGTAYLAGGAR